LRGYSQNTYDLVATIDNRSLLLLHNPMDTPHKGLALPYHLSEESFRKYEDVLARAVSAYPLCYRITPKDLGLSQITFASRLRDAKRSLRDYKWPTRIDMEKFLDIYDNLVVAEREGHVLIGSKESVRGPTSPYAPDEYHVACGDSYPVLVKTIVEKALLVRLSHDRVFSKPLLVDGYSLDEVSFFEQNYDVTFELQNDGRHILR
ncbi:MAG: hypothetical protein L0213_00230, partial [Candidatus Dadabacteria bacterium]|nr:hypothetical protein [Candidatus Dadabacteria bacterium]